MIAVRKMSLRDAMHGIFVKMGMPALSTRDTGLRRAYLESVLEDERCVGDDAVQRGVVSDELLQLLCLGGDDVVQLPAFSSQFTCLVASQTCVYIAGTQRHLATLLKVTAAKC